MNPIKKAIAWYKRPKSKTADFFESLIVIIPLAFAIRTLFFGLYHVPTGSMETTMLTGERFFADKLTPYLRDFRHGEIIAFNFPLYAYSKNPIIRWWQMYVGYPWQIQNWTKRIIGVPGDTIKGTIENGKPVVYRNGVKLDEPYLNKYPLIATYDPDRPKDFDFVPKSYVPGIAFDQQPFYKLTDDEVMFGKRFARLYGQQDIKKPGEPYDAVLNAGTPHEHPIDVFEVKLGPDEYWAMGDNRRGSWDSRFWGPLKKEFIHARILFRIWSIDIESSWWIFQVFLHPIDFWRNVRWSRCLQFVH